MTDISCPICRSTDAKHIRAGISCQFIKADDFKITDSKYGQTGPLYRCKSCSFLFVVFKDDCADYYTQMEDKEYEQGRTYRTVQQKILLKHLLAKFPETKTLLDVGAGTGMLVEEAQKAGLNPLGVELSSWCVDVAKAQGLPVIKGAIAHQDLAGRYFDAVTLIDVIEHVSDPIELLISCANHLQSGNPLILVTPDVNSFTSHLLGKRWWHYRIAHIGYYSKRTVSLALEKAGFTVVSIRRPAWYFQVQYLYERLKQYLPLPDLAKRSNVISRKIFPLIIPLNLRDSLEIIACKK